MKNNDFFIDTNIILQTLEDIQATTGLPNDIITFLREAALEKITRDRDREVMKRRILEAINNQYDDSYGPLPIPNHISDIEPRI